MAFDNSVVPVFLITGFLDSGKTTFIKNIIASGFFDPEGGKTLLIQTEEGEEEVEDELLDMYNIDLVVFEDKSEFTYTKLKELRRKMRPKQVILEWNGMWPVSEIIQMDLPLHWEIFQVISTVDASNFQMYLNNMRSIFNDIFTYTEMAIFNRCNEDTDMSFIIRNVKVVNNRAELNFEDEDGNPVDPGEEILPYDVNQPEILISNDDYGTWYLDALDHQERYDGKTVTITGMVFKSKNFTEEYFVPGRMAMTCCADDMTFIGFMCKSAFAKNLTNKQWVKVTAEMHYEEREEYHGIGPVLYAKNITKAEKPEEPMVSFN